MILGFVEHERGKLNEASLEMLTLARRLAAELAVPLHGVVLGGDGLAEAIEQALKQTAYVNQRWREENPWPLTKDMT